uniref:DUF7746 domain-containing protein n=1 Tax=Vitis vinifera TaxID=29760 RepID=A5BJS2_VITVI|nr:hypothetical protein VITISV_021083 [Vitis vinifera]
MMMAANAYRIKTSNSDFHAAGALVIGFTGLLKGWWDHYLSQNDREYILNAKKTIIKEEGTSVQTYEEDAVNTLIFAITKHFIGDPVYFQERTSEILNNLRCPTLQDFKWYKDMFLVKVMSRPDCGNHYWKEKFISGLPTLFAEKVRQRIRNIHNGRIPYESLTYGELITFVNNEGLMIDKENDESSENYESEEDNQILITQEISSEGSSLEEESDNQKDCDDSKLSQEGQECQISRFSFFKLKNLDLLESIRQMICEKAKATGEAKQEHIMQFLADCSTFGITIQGMSFTWISCYDNTYNNCPKTDPLCREIPLERHDCKCALTYSICKANIDLDSYKPIVIKFNNESIELTPTLLMDYGVLYQLIFSHPDQTDKFGRKLAICVLNAFINDFKSVELIIESKPPEWSNDGGVYPAQHLILLKANQRKHQLFGTEDPWPCTKSSLKKQIRHWRSRIIARDLDSEIYSSSNYNLITEDNIQKIISANNFHEVPLLFQTQFTYLVDKYKKEYVLEEEARKTFEKYLLEMLN